MAGCKIGGSNHHSVCNVYDIELMCNSERDQKELLEKLVDQVLTMNCRNKEGMIFSETKSSVLTIEAVKLIE